MYFHCLVSTVYFLGPYGLIMLICSWTCLNLKWPTSKFKRGMERNGVFIIFHMALLTVTQRADVVLLIHDRDF